jgi:hypothetical protein
MATLQELALANQQLMQGFESLTQSVQQVKMQRLLNQANMQAQQIRAQEMDEAKKMQAIQALGQDLALQLGGLGAAPQMMQAGQRAVDPDLELRQQLRLLGAQQQMGNRDLLVPGFGVAINKDSARNLAETADIGLDRKSIAEGRSKRTTLMSTLRRTIAGGGTTSDKDIDLILETIPDVTDLTELDSTAETKLKALLDLTDRSVQSAAERAGLGQAAAPTIPGLRRR